MGEDGRRGQKNTAWKLYTDSVSPTVACRVSMIQYPNHKQIENTSILYCRRLEIWFSVDPKEGRGSETLTNVENTQNKCRFNTLPLKSL